MKCIATMQPVPTATCEVSSSMLDCRTLHVRSSMVWEVVVATTVEPYGWELEVYEICGAHHRAQGALYLLILKFRLVFSPLG